MKLHFALASPFARKVRVAAIELGIEDKLELVPTVVAPGQPNAEYAGRFNPIRRIPALTLSDGRTLIDSTVICEYLCDMVGGGKLFPKPSGRRWAVMTDHSLATGMTEIAVLLRYETALRPDANRWQSWIDDHTEKINNGLAAFEQRAFEPGDSTVDISRIALACFLGYLDFRFSDSIPWRGDAPQLSAWYETFSERPSMRNTQPEPSA